MADVAPEPNLPPPPSPWGRIARAAGLAFDARKVILAALGLLIFAIGNAGLNFAFQIFTHSTSPVLEGNTLDGDVHGVFQWVDPRIGPAFAGHNGVPYANIIRMIGPEEQFRDWLWSRPRGLVEPAVALMRPFFALFATGPGSGGWGFPQAFLASIWAAVVWGLIGGAISRVAAVEAGTGGRIGIATALRFSIRKAVGFVGSPLCPLIAVGLFGALCGLFGLLYQIPGGVGATIAGVLAFLPLLAGLVMTLILAGLAAGWPLMIASVAVEGEDAFDALSRTYAYVFQRPARYAAFLAWAWLVGTLGLVVVSLFAKAVPHLTEWGLAFGAPDALLDDLFHGQRPANDPAAATHRFWLGVIDLLARGWIYAFFWTAATQIYLLLRRDVDGTPTGEVYLPEHDADTFAPEPGPAKPDAPGEIAGAPIKPTVPEIGP